MEEINVQRKLRSYAVNIQLLWDIEEHIIKKLPDIMSFSSLQGNNHLEGHTTLLLSGHSGTEHFTPVTKYTQQRFDNDIEKVALEFNYWAGQHTGEPQAAMINIGFSTNAGDSELSITLRAQGAREKAIALERSLLQMLEKYKTINWIPYPNEIIPTFVFVGGFITFLFALMVADPILKTICILIFSSAVYLFMHRFMKGYCSLDSNRQKTLDAVFKWIITTIAVLIIISILTPLRKMLWGF